MVNFDYNTKENIKKHNPYWLQILVYPCRILIIWGFGHQTNALFDII